MRSQKTETTASATTATTYAYDANDRLTQETKTTGANNVVTTYTWDDKGNLSTKSTGGQVTVYGWNADNRLVEVTQGSSQATAITVARYSYDANGNRVQKSEPGQNSSPDKVINYLVDDTFAYAQTVQETMTQGGATESTSYVWGNGLIQQSRAGQLNYYHADALGSTKVLTDSSGNVTDAYQYDVFGAVLNKTGATANNYRYTGEYFDESINLQYNRARWYDANAARFTSMDTFRGKTAVPVTLNKYLYSNSDPVNYFDPTGLASTNLSEVGITTEINGSLASGRSATFQVTMRKTGCFVITTAIGQVIDQGIYVFLDAAVGMPYVGKTIQGFGKMHLFGINRSGLCTKFCGFK